MDDQKLIIFIDQVAIQCDYFISSVHTMNEGLANSDDGHMIFGAQVLLNAAANISKLLWGQSGTKTYKKMKVERQALRDVLGVSEQSLLRNVTVRNNFEHIDERIDQWWDESKTRKIIDNYVRPRFHAISGVDPIDIFRFYDPGTKKIVFWGEEFDVAAATKEIERLMD